MASDDGFSFRHIGTRQGRTLQKLVSFKLSPAARRGICRPSTDVTLTPDLIGIYFPSPVGVLAFLAPSFRGEMSGQLELKGSWTISGCIEWSSSSSSCFLCTREEKRSGKMIPISTLEGGGRGDALFIRKQTTRYLSTSSAPPAQ